MGLYEGFTIVAKTIDSLPTASRQRVVACIVSLAADAAGVLYEPPVQALLRSLASGKDASLAHDRLIREMKLPDPGLRWKNAPALGMLGRLLRDARWGSHHNMIATTVGLITGPKAGLQIEALGMIGRCLSDGENKQTGLEIFRGFVRLLWTGYWADERERRREEGRRSYRFQPQEDIYRAAPRAPGEATETARSIALDIVAANGNRSLSALYLEAMGEHPEEHLRFATPEEFGNMLAFMTTGAGVSWYDDHPEFGLKMPHREFYL